jgi:hypothetical protein
LLINLVDIQCRKSFRTGAILVCILACRINWSTQH